MDVASPVLWGQFEGLVDDPIGHGDAEGGPPGLELVLPSLEQNLVVSLDALLLLLLRCHKPAGTETERQGQGERDRH